MIQAIPALLLAVAATGTVAHQQVPSKELGELVVAAGADRAVADALVARLDGASGPDRWGPVLLATIRPLSAFDEQPSNPGVLRSCLDLAEAERAVFAGDYDAARVSLASAGGRVYSPLLRDYLTLIVAHADVDLEKAGEVAARLGDRIENLGPARRAVAQRLMEDLARHSAVDASANPLLLATREMREAQRRLDVERLGEPLMRHQQRALELLDQQIEQLEKQREEQQQQMSAGSGSRSAGGQAADDSRPMGGKGAGASAPRPLAAGDPWGELPPAERERLVRELQQRLPTASRELIESYYQSLAEGSRTEEADE